MKKLAVAIAALVLVLMLMGIVGWLDWLWIAPALVCVFHVKPFRDAAISPKAQASNNIVLVSLLAVALGTGVYLHAVAQPSVNLTAER